MFDYPYGHTPYDKAFGGDVYGVGYDEARAARAPIRLGMIGGGGVAQSKYLPTIARLRMIWEPVAVTAFAEPRADHAAKIRAVYGGAHYSDYRHMLRDEALDAVLVLSPDHLHAEHTLACLEHGLPVLVEKPIARSLVEAVGMVEAAQKADRVLMTVANKRFSPPYRRAKWLVEYGVCQNPALFSGKFNLGYADVDLFEAGTIHLFDLVGYLMGPVEAVSAAGVRRYAASAYPLDNAAVTLRFRSGAVGSLYTSASALSFKPWERVEVYSNHAWLAVEDQHQLILYDSEMDGARLWQPVVPNTLLFDEEFGGYMGLVENFIQAVRGAERPVVTGADGRAAFELLRAVQIAIARREWVSLPLSPAEADAEAARWLTGED